MSQGMVRRLVAKDLYLYRWTVAFYIVAGAVALGVLAVPAEGAFYAGSVLLISSLLAIGVHLVMVSVVQERKQKTLPFVMTLPISPMQYTAGKILANLGAFAIAWVTLMTATLLVISGRGSLPNGLLPFAVLVLTEIFASYCLLLGVALVSESEGWTILAIVVCNLLFNFFLYTVSKAPAIAEHFEGPSAVWNAPVAWILAAELAAMALILGATFYLQSRKRDFV